MLGSDVQYHVKLFFDAPCAPLQVQGFYIVHVHCVSKNYIGSHHILYSIAQPRQDCDWTRMSLEGLTASQNAPNDSYGSYDHST